MLSNGVKCSQEGPIGKCTYRLAVFVSRIDKFFRHFTKICDPVVYNAEIPFLQFRFQFQTVQQGKICI